MDKANWVFLIVGFIVAVGIAVSVLFTGSGKSSDGGPKKAADKTLTTVRNKIVLGFNGPFAIAVVLVAALLLNVFVVHWNPFAGFRNHSRVPSAISASYSSTHLETQHCAEDPHTLVITKGETTWTNVPAHCFSRVDVPNADDVFDLSCKDLESGDEHDWSDEDCKKAGIAVGFRLKPDSPDEARKITVSYTDYK